MLVLKYISSWIMLILCLKLELLIDVLMLIWDIMYMIIEMFGCFVFNIVRNINSCVSGVVMMVVIWFMFFFLELMWE